VAGARAATGTGSAPRAGAGSLPRCGSWSSGHAEPVALLGTQTDPSLLTFKLTLASLVLVGQALMRVRGMSLAVPGWRAAWPLPRSGSVNTGFLGWPLRVPSWSSPPSPWSGSDRRMRALAPAAAPGGNIAAPAPITPVATASTWNRRFDGRDARVTLRSRCAATLLYEPTRTTTRQPSCWCNALLREGSWWTPRWGSLDGMQGVRGSNPLSSTTIEAQVNRRVAPGPSTPPPRLIRARGTPGA
jgi:hypothetical protein